MARWNGCLYVCIVCMMKIPFDGGLLEIKKMGEREGEREEAEQIGQEGEEEEGEVCEERIGRSPSGYVG